MGTYRKKRLIGLFLLVLIALLLLTPQKNQPIKRQQKRPFRVSLPLSSLQKIPAIPPHFWRNFQENGGQKRLLKPLNSSRSRTFLWL